MLQTVRGNLLDAETEALVNTVNTVGVMGKGVALQFKKAFPENFKAYRRACEAGHLHPGGVFTFDAGGLSAPRYVFNVATKKHWKGKATLEYVESGLAALVQEVRRLHVRSIAVPPLGCGHGGLQWTDVAPRIEEAFAGLPDVEVLVFEPAGAPEPGTIRNRTAKPKMTAGRAAVLALMNRYLVPGFDYALTVLEIQKLAYFLQESGQPLRLQYDQGHYGPYADSLRHVLNHIEGHYIRGYGAGENKPDTSIELLEGAAAQAEAFLANDVATQQRFGRVGELIEGFETPFGMELLATVHWVGKKDDAARDSAEVAFQQVRLRNTRKANLMKAGHVAAAWERLRAHGWLQ